MKNYILVSLLCASMDGKCDILPKSEIENLWKEGDIKVSYFVHEDNTLSMFRVMHGKKFVCSYGIGNAGNRSGSVLFEPNSAVTVTVAFASIGENNASQVTAIALKMGEANDKKTIVLQWDFDKSKFIKVEPEPDPFED